MPKFLTTTGVSHEVENIIKGAKNKLALVSPYLKLSQNFYERLRDADKKNVVILIVYGKVELNSEQKRQLADLKNLKLFFCANLHAKCYMNENSCVITSMNMYEFSEKNNREIGVLFSRTEDQSIFMETAEEIKSIIGNSKESDILELNLPESIKTLTPTPQQNKGYKARSATIQKSICNFIFRRNFECRFKSFKNG
jgi:phosphatidylserine/phosphatidylglycerophosphate/cardiolipin synthase-like enzyme